MAYQPARDLTAPLNPTDVSQYSTAQAEQKASYQQVQKTYGPTGDDYWKSQIAGTIQSQGGLSSLTIGKALSPKSLQDDAVNVRNQSDQLKSRLSDLEYLLFEPTPSNASQGIDTKDNPSTVEGNIQHSSRSLASAILTLERVLSKIGGR